MKRLTEIYFRMTAGGASDGDADTALAALLVEKDEGTMFVD